MSAGMETVAFFFWSVTVGAFFTQNESRSCWPGGNSPRAWREAEQSRGARAA